ncbi:MAG TPA: Ig-like domain repeat protein, partial [Acidimicrobiales bacterium]|nr:Ig-like domain repeat protein [Acidimicrobiales bacterium]
MSANTERASHRKKRVGATRFLQMARPNRSRCLGGSRAFVSALIVGASTLFAQSAGAATPNAPSSVVVSFTSVGAVVSWTAPSPVSGVTILGYTVTVSPGTESCTVAAPGTSCTIPSFPANTSATFSVVAESPGGAGPAGTSSQLTSPTEAAASISVGALQPSPQNVGSPVSFVATVTPGATGTVDFLVGSTTIPGCAAQSVTSGFAMCTTTTLVAGTNSVTAVYSGDANYLSATSSALGYPISSTTLASQASLLILATTFGPGNVALTLSTSGGSGSGAVTYTTYDGTATGCSVSGATLTMTSAGTCYVVAEKAADSTYLPQASNATMVTFFASYAAIYSVTGYTTVYSCPQGGTLSGTTCLGQSQPASVSYTCPSGGTLSGTSCVTTTTSSYPASYHSGPGYYCPAGGVDGDGITDSLS